MEGGNAVKISDPWDQSFKRVEKWSFQTLEIKGGVLGTYECKDYEPEEQNDYHFITISNKGRGQLCWTTRHGVKWTIQKTDDPLKYKVKDDCSYYSKGYTHMEVTLKDDNSVKLVTGPWDEPFTKMD